MKILLCHNFYQQAGGEDQVFADEAALLESHGHEVVRYTIHNDAIHEMRRVAIAAKTLWNRDTSREITKILRSDRPDVVHFTNTFPLISPAAYYAAKSESIPVVQSLHNYRLLCPASTFYREGKPCEDCLGKGIPWPAVLHGCYRSSRLATGVVAGMTTLHRLMRTWQRTVDRFVALSHFSAEKFIAGGLPAGKIVVKPNFIAPDPGPGSGAGRYALFVGRLAAEKGIETLLAAWEQLDETLPLKIVGDGPLASFVEERCTDNPRIAWLGWKSGSEVMQLMSEATCLMMPSEWYECCPKTLIESFAVGTPAVVSRLGAMAEMVEHERTGFHFEPRNPHDLASQIKRLVGDPALASKMRHFARQQFEEKYTADLNYEQLMNIYRGVLRPAAVVNSTVFHPQAELRQPYNQDTTHDSSNVDSLAQPF